MSGRGFAAVLVEELGLIPHPEGGFYKETYRSVDEAAALPTRFGIGHAPLPYCTSIYYLLEAPDFSAFHRIRSDELWYFHAGTGLVIHCLGSGGSYRRLELGPGKGYFATVSAGEWFSAEPLGPRPADAEPLGPRPVGPGERPWFLVSCAVSPGFDFCDFEIAEGALLTADYPQHADLIRRLTRR